MIKGNLSKMEVELENGIAQYFLPLPDQRLLVNSLIGKEITLSHTGTINCVNCNIETSKSYQQGYCGRCVSILPECDKCMIKPELCSYQQGGCRDNAWGEANCFNDHLVYLSFTGTRKVGITKHMNMEDGYSSRWVDQGATSAISFLRVKNRFLSGEVEVAIKAHISDRTNWRKMLKLQEPDNEMLSVANELRELVAEEIYLLQAKYGLNAIQWVSDLSVKHIEYPVVSYPEKIKSINLDKTPEFTGKLSGIKGQYLIFEDGRVINFRKYAGYLVTILANS
jgi:hypothetical protein